MAILKVLILSLVIAHMVMRHSSKHLCISKAHTVMRHMAMHHNKVSNKLRLPIVNNNCCVKKPAFIAGFFY
jgi:hypothetical protein